MRYRKNKHCLGQTNASWLMQMFLVMIIVVLALDLTRRFVSLHSRAMSKRNLSPVPVVTLEPTNTYNQTNRILTLPMAVEAPEFVPKPPVVVPFVQAAPIPPSKPLPVAVAPLEQAHVWPRPMHRGLGLPPGTVSVQYFNPRTITLISVPVDEVEGGVPTWQGEPSTVESESPAGEGVGTVLKVGLPPGKGGPPTGKGAAPAGEGDPQEPAPPAPSPDP